MKSLKMISAVLALVAAFTFTAFAQSFVIQHSASSRNYDNSIGYYPFGVETLATLYATGGNFPATASGTVSGTTANGMRVAMVDSYGVRTFCNLTYVGTGQINFDVPTAFLSGHALGYYGSNEIEVYTSSGGVDTLEREVTGLTVQNYGVPQTFTTGVTVSGTNYAHASGTLYGWDNVANAYVAVKSLADGTVNPRVINGHDTIAQVYLSGGIVNGTSQGTLYVNRFNGEPQQTTTPYAAGWFGVQVANITLGTQFGTGVKPFTMGHAGQSILNTFYIWMS